MTIPLDIGAPEQANTPGDFPRNAAKAPYVSDPSGAVVKSGARKGQPKRVLYGRPSGLGKNVGDGFALSQWSQRMVLCGIVTDAALAAEARALLDMDQESREFKELANALADRAKDAAKAGLAAERGTHTHALTEDHDNEVDWVARAEAGVDLGIPHEAQQALVDVWRRCLADNGLEVLATEAKVVNDRLRVAGTLDRIVRLTRPLTFGDITVPAGTVLVLDIKTGKMRTTP